MAGPSTLLTQSEVATMDFVRTKFEAPVPKVMAYSTTMKNPVGVEYIIMQPMPGETMGKRHEEALQDGNLGPIIRQLARLQMQLASVPFSQLGSIYYKEDVNPKL